MLLNNWIIKYSIMGNGESGKTRGANRHIVDQFLKWSVGKEKERFLDVRSKDEKKVSLDEIYYNIFIRIKQKKPLHSC